MTSATVAALLDAAAGSLATVSESPRLDAELLLARAIDMPRSFLFAHPDAEVDAAAVARFERSLARRLDGEPLAYIQGSREFWSLELMVTEATLVPRPETELLVEQALGFLPRRAELDVLDLGTGSGAIALAIARERPLCRVTATDVSAAALAVARQNARQLDLPNVEFVEGAWTAPLRDRLFDVIVSNPPYVAAGDPALARLRYEPQTALVGGDDGLDALRALASECPAVAKPGAALLVEHAPDQQDAVQDLFAAAGWQDPHTICDHAGCPRVTIARMPRD